jgi:hypothetical protein
VGRTGATESPPWATVLDSGRDLTGASDIDEEVEDVDAFRTGEKDDIAEPGRAGRLLFAMAAFFWANIVSLREGFGGPVVLFEKPMPGRAFIASGFLGELGLSGAFSSNLC